MQPNEEFTPLVAGSSNVIADYLKQLRLYVGRTIEMAPYTSAALATFGLAAAWTALLVMALFLFAAALVLITLLSHIIVVLKHLAGFGGERLAEA